jgi:hypothetical protein
MDALRVLRNIEGLNTISNLCADRFSNGLKKISRGWIVFEKIE